jgi:translation initiation factor 6
MIIQLSFDRSDFIGVYGRVSEKYGVFGRGVPDICIEEAEKNLGVTAIRTTIAYVDIVGTMVAMNSNGMVVNRFVNGIEEKKLRELGISIAYTLPSMNAAGNLILTNDKRALVGTKTPKSMINEIEEALGVEVVSENVGLSNVGMAFALTNKSILCHPDASDETLHALEELFKVRGGWGTVNHGMPLVGCGMVCNSHGVLIVKRTTTVEIARIQDTLEG